MHAPLWNRSRRMVMAAAAVCLLASLMGCPKHEQFPSDIVFVEPPTPANFVITRPDPEQNDLDFSWSVPDAGAVDRYRLYVLGGGVIPDELVLETTQTTALATLPFDPAGLQFAVSAVSTSNVEGKRATAAVPTP